MSHQPIKPSSAETAADASDRGALTPGEMVGRYQLLTLLANGGMGQVWAARPVGSGFARTVALKIIRSEMSGDENYARMFIDEATLASSIRHPNVAEIYELGRHEDRLFMAMEWVAGDSLAGLLRVNEELVALDTLVAARIVADACAGLHAAHESVGPDGAALGVVHRDISPPNILVSAQGQAKVSDFGIAKARFQLHERTKTGEVKGKFAYIPPEQFAGGPLDRRADIYAMGCVLYVATLGLRPFGNGASALPKILRNDYKKPRVLVPDYPQELDAIVVQALALAPNDRFQTAEDLQIALEEWLRSTGKRVTASNVAKLVKERMSEDVRVRNEALISQSRALPAALISQLVDVDSETPTAGSGLVTAPAALWIGSGYRAKAAASEPRNSSPGRTSQTDLELQARLVAQKPRASDATGLVDFVPVGGAAPRPQPPETLPLDPLAEASERSKLLAAKIATFTALAVLLAIAAWLSWR